MFDTISGLDSDEQWSISPSFGYSIKPDGSSTAYHRIAAAGGRHGTDPLTV